MLLQLMTSSWQVEMIFETELKLAAAVPSNVLKVFSIFFSKRRLKNYFSPGWKEIPRSLFLKMKNKDEAKNFCDTKPGSYVFVKCFYWFFVSLLFKMIQRRKNKIIFMARLFHFSKTEIGWFLVIVLFSFLIILWYFGLVFIYPAHI